MGRDTEIERRQVHVSTASKLCKKRPADEEQTQLIGLASKAGLQGIELLNNQVDYLLCSCCDCVPVLVKNSDRSSPRLGDPRAPVAIVKYVCTLYL
eukprot:4115064-Amphidinium_carterae.1